MVKAQQTGGEWKKEFQAGNLCWFVNGTVFQWSVQKERAKMLKVIKETL